VRDTLTTRAAEPIALDLELATRSEAAADAALAALRTRPPERCDRCGNRTFHPRQGGELAGWWRCRTCHGGTFRALPTPAEEAAATREARDTATTAVLATHEGLRHLQALVRADHRRDRRTMTPAISRSMQKALLHRADPIRYPATGAVPEEDWILGVSPYSVLSLWRGASLAWLGRISEGLAELDRCVRLAGEDARPEMVGGGGVGNVTPHAVSRTPRRGVAVVGRDAAMKPQYLVPAGDEIARRPRRLTLNPLGYASAPCRITRPCTDTGGPRRASFQ
jgi:hypothetical protein